jgi:hypothetical protein
MGDVAEGAILALIDTGVSDEADWVTHTPARERMPIVSDLHGSYVLERVRKSFDSVVLSVNVMREGVRGIFGSDEQRGFEIALEWGVRVINVSISGSRTDRAERQALAAENAGAVYVRASGRGGHYPEEPDMEEMVVVAATRAASERGGHVDLVAPEDASSYAAGYVSGVFAEMFAICPELTPDRARHIVYSTAKPMGEHGRDPVYGWGEIDAEAAIETTRQFKRIVGDINDDGRVDLADFSILAGQFGKRGEGLSGDLNRDGVVNVADVSVMAGQLGKRRGGEGVTKQ